MIRRVQGVASDATRNLKLDSPFHSSFHCILDFPRKPFKVGTRLDDPKEFDSADAFRARLNGLKEDGNREGCAGGARDEDEGVVL
jgi:hypothetical protein